MNPCTCDPVQCPFELAFCTTAFNKLQIRPQWRKLCSPINNLRERIQAGAYRPYPAHSLDIPKRGHSVQSSHPQDRILMRLLHEVLQPSPPANAYGWYAGKGREAAVQHVRDSMKMTGAKCMVFADIQQAFTSVARHQLHQVIMDRFHCTRLWSVILLFLGPGRGIPHGNGLGPALMNRLLLPVDLNHPQVIRYADDFAIPTTRDLVFSDIQGLSADLGNLGMHLEANKTHTLYLDGLDSLDHPRPVMWLQLRVYP